jgi:hypothetical protein
MLLLPTTPQPACLPACLSTTRQLRTMLYQAARRELRFHNTQRTVARRAVHPRPGSRPGSGYRRQLASPWLGHSTLNSYAFPFTLPAYMPSIFSYTRTLIKHLLEVWRKDSSVVCCTGTAAAFDC